MINVIYVFRFKATRAMYRERRYVFFFFFVSPPLLHLHIYYINMHIKPGLYFKMLTVLIFKNVNVLIKDIKPYRLKTMNNVSGTLIFNIFKQSFNWYKDIFLSTISFCIYSYT